MVPGQVEAVPHASAAGHGECRRTRLDGLTDLVPDSDRSGSFGLRGEVLEGEAESLVSDFQGKATCFVLPSSRHEFQNSGHRLLVRD